MSDVGRLPSHYEAPAAGILPLDPEVAPPGWKTPTRRKVHRQFAGTLTGFLVVECVEELQDSGVPHDQSIIRHHCSPCLEKPPSKAAAPAEPTTYRPVSQGQPKNMTYVTTSGDTHAMLVSRRRRSRDRP
jgi:hypothetical protein